MARLVSDGQSVAAGESATNRDADGVLLQLTAALGGDREALVLAESFLAADRRRSVGDYLERVDEITAARDPAIDRGPFFPAFWISLEAAEAVHESAGAVLAFAAISPAGEMPIAAYLQPVECYPAELQPVAGDPTLFADILSVLSRLRLIEMRPGGTRFALASQTRSALLDLLGDARPTWQSIFDAVWARLTIVEPQINGLPTDDDTAEEILPAVKPQLVEHVAAESEPPTPTEGRAVRADDQRLAAAAAIAPAVAVTLQDEAKILILPVGMSAVGAIVEEAERPFEFDRALLDEPDPVPTAEPMRLSAPVAGDEVGRKTSGGLQARLDTLRQLAGSSPDVSQRPAANAEGGDEKEDLLRRRNSFVARLLGRR